MTNRPAQPLPPAEPPHGATETWFSLAHAIYPAITDDPGWPALAHALQRAEAAGYPAREQLPALAAQVLPDENPARALHYRLVDATEHAAAVEPAQRPEHPGRTATPRSHPLPGTRSPQSPGPAR